MSCFGENWGLEYSREEINRALNRNEILSLELELSHACNLRCVYCYAASGSPLKDELSLPEIKNIIEQAVALGAKKIIVLGGGEPLLYPHLFEVIDMILQKGVEADLFTNGTMISEKVAQKLYDRKTSIVLKQNSQVPEVQDFLAGKEGSHSEIEVGLKNLLKVGYPSKEHNLGIETIICQQNYDEIPTLWRWARRQGIIPYVETMTMQGRAKDHSNLEVSIDKIRVLFEELAKIDKEEFNTSWTPHPPLAASQCSRHEYSCTVVSNGDINPCPGVNITVGNIRENSLKNILANSIVMQDLRNIRSTIKGQCGSCDLNDNCYGCRGHAYQISGDYLAEDALCWIKHKNVA
jgi:radical SAM protein with 4Fe4S-binding SPASM domain